MIRTGLIALAAAATLATGAANATVIATSAIGATSAPFALGSFGNTGINGLVSTTPMAFGNGTITFSPDASTPQAGLYDGSVTNVASSAYSQTSITPTNYLVAEPNDPVNITFGSGVTQFQLLWGSVDTFNSITFTTSTGTTTVTGTQIQNQTGNNGPAFVTVSGIGTITAATFNSTTAAFEFVPSVPTAAPTSVPEPASMAVLGAGLAGLGFVRRRRANKA